MPEGKKSMIKVWDLPVRVFHWLLAVLFAASIYSAYQDKFGIYADIHLWSGVAIITLVVWRTVWGLVGSDTARFSTSLKGPATIFAYLRGRAEPGVGHNPLGAYAVVLMLSLVLAQAVLGLYSSDGMLFNGPLAGSDGDDIQDIHEQLGYILFGVIGLHVTAILWYLVIRKDNLVTPMITGTKPSVAAQPRLRSPLLALVILLGVAAVVYLAIF